MDFISILLVKISWVINIPAAEFQVFFDKKILGSYLTRLWPIFFGLSIILLKKESKFFNFNYNIYFI